MRNQVKEIFVKNDKFSSLSKTKQNIILKDFQIWLSLSSFEEWMEEFVNEKEDVTEEASLKIEIEQAKRYIKKYLII